MSGKISSHSSDETDLSPINDINVTPFVDVVLVLLVIFMITAPALMKDLVGIQLPKATNTDTLTPPKTLGVALNRQGQVLLNGSPVSLEDLSKAASQALQENPETSAILSADGESRHAELVKIIDTLKTAGLHRFAIQIQKEQ